MPDADSKSESDASEITEPLDIEVSTKDSNLPSDRILNQIRSRTIKRGQFGIGSALIMTAVVALYCASPNILGYEPKRYFLTHAVMAWLFLPGIVYIIFRAGNLYGFPRLTMLSIGAILVVLPTAIAVWVEPGLLAGAILWIPQLPLLYWIHSLYRVPNRTAKNIQKRYDEAVGAEVSERV